MSLICRLHCKAKKTIPTFIVAMLVYGSLLGCTKSCSNNESDVKDLQNITVRMNWTIYGEHAPFFIAQDKGFYKEEGLDVDVLPGSGSATTARLVSDGQNDFGYSGASTVVKLISEGLPVKAVSVFNQIDATAIIFKASTGIKSVHDLVGKRIALTTGDAASQVITLLLASEQIDPSAVTFLWFPTPEAKERAILTGAADAFIGYYYDQPPRLKYVNKEDIRWIPFTQYGINILGSALIANTKMIEENPDLVRRFVKATQKGFKFARDNPEEAAKIFIKHWNVYPQKEMIELLDIFSNLYFTEYSAGHPLGWSAAVDWEKTLDYVQKFAKVRGQKNVEIYYTNEFLSDVK